MTATGFVLVMAAVLYFNAYNDWSSKKIIENLWAFVGISGILLLVTGIATWLWRVMP